MSVSTSVRHFVVAFSWIISTSSGEVGVKFSVATFMKMGREKLSLVKVRQTFEALDKKTEVFLWLFVTKFFPK